MKQRIEKECPEEGSNYGYSLSALSEGVTVQKGKIK